MSSDFRDDPALQRILQDLEVERKSVLSSRIKAFAVLGFAALIIVAGIFLGVMPPLGYVGAGLIAILGVILLYKAQAPFDAYKSSFKLKVVAAALQSIDRSLIIEPESGLSEAEFISSQLFTEEPDRYNSEDQVSGQAGKTNFYFSEVHAEYKTVTTDSKGRRQETWHDIVKGIIFTADFNKNFNGITVIRPKDIGSTLGAWISKAVPVFFSKNSQLVELENIAFSKTFITHSTDQIEARYILTPAMMDKLCELNQRSSYTVSLSFIQSRVYIAFPLKDNYFEPPLLKSLLNPSCLQEDLQIIQFMYGIVQDLDLNTRIWGKE